MPMAGRSSCQWVNVVLLVLFLAAAAGVSEGQSSPLPPAIYVFGDSTVDAGNNNNILTIVKCNFLPYGRDLPQNVPTGRFTNGLIIPDYAAQGLGLPYPMPYLSSKGGEDWFPKAVNFASGASGWLNTTAVPYSVLTFADQVQNFRRYKAELSAMVGQERADYITSNALYVVSCGNNDYVLSYYINPLIEAKYTLPDYQELIKQTAGAYYKDLYALGARNFGVASNPALGCLPAMINLNGYRGLSKDGCVSSINDAILKGNFIFEKELLPSLQAQLPGFNFLFFPLYGSLLEVYANPSAAGYKNTRTACCGTGTLEVSILCNPATPGTCQDSDDYLFFDSFHPTSQVYKKIYDKAVFPVLQAAYNL